MDVTTTKTADVRQHSVDTRQENTIAVARTTPSSKCKRERVERVGRVKCSAGQRTVSIPSRRVHLACSTRTVGTTLTRKDARRTSRLLPRFASLCTTHPINAQPSIGSRAISRLRRASATKRVRAANVQLNAMNGGRICSVMPCHAMPCRVASASVQTLVLLSAIESLSFVILSASPVSLSKLGSYSPVSTRDTSRPRRDDMHPSPTPVRIISPSHWHPL
jgi:hypothetical protein